MNTSSQFNLDPIRQETMDHSSNEQTKAHKHPAKDHISLHGNSHCVPPPNSAHLIANPLHPCDPNTPSHLWLSQINLSESQSRENAQCIGQSPPSRSDHKNDLAKAHLIEAAKNNSGVFQFTSRTSLQNAKAAAMSNIIQEGKRLNRTAVGQLLKEFIGEGCKPVALGDGYTMTGIQATTAHQSSANRQEFIVTVEKDNLEQRIVCTLYHSVTFDGLAIPADGLIEANNALSEHLISQARNSCSISYSATASASNNQILSAMGVGRCAAVAVLNIFDHEIANTTDLDSIRVEEKIDDIICKGREQISPAFVHTKLQRLEIIEAAHKLLNRTKETINTLYSEQIASSTSSSDSGRSNQLETESDDTPDSPTGSEPIANETPEVDEYIPTGNLSLRFKAEKPFFENPRDFHLTLSQFGSAANKINKQGNNRCYLSAINDILMLSDIVNGINEEELLFFQATKVREGYEEALIEQRRCQPFVAPAGLSPENVEACREIHEATIQEQAMACVQARFSLEQENYEQLMNIFPEHFGGLDFQPVHRSQSATWIKHHRIDALTLTLAYNELSRQLRESQLHEHHPYWHSLPERIDYIRLTSPEQNGRFVNAINHTLKSDSANQPKPRNMIILYPNHAAHVMQLDNQQWLSTDYTKQRPTNNLELLLSFRFNSPDGKIHEHNASVVLLDADFVNQFHLSQNQTNQAVH